MRSAQELYQQARRYADHAADDYAAAAAAKGRTAKAQYTLNAETKTMYAQRYAAAARAQQRREQATW